MDDQIMAELMGARLVVWNSGESMELYHSGFFGKPVGIPKPKPGQTFDAPLMLDLMEGLYLMDEGRIAVIDSQTGTPMTRRKLISLARKVYKHFDLAYKVYMDLRKRGFVVTPGIKFGSDFAVYEHGPGIDHAPFIVTVRSQDDLMGPFEIVRAGRLATTVRKQFTIAVTRPNSKTINYLVFRWFKA